MNDDLLNFLGEHSQFISAHNRWTELSAESISEYAVDRRVREQKQAELMKR